ncbi:MAG: type II secretion system protein GspE [Nitrospirae bacterium RIFCSPHIGHO2_01_FULL_66_17]|nr:MAG: type II secretion system protein GspE [Nitrospirae bacterium RIFCSPHIGHO2_01_FULL_66_17]
MERPKPRLLGEILKSRFGLAGERLDEALAVQREKGGRIGDILVRLGYVKEDAVLEALGEQLGVPYARHLSAADVDKTLAAKVPIAFAKRFEVLPLREAGGVVQVATAHPSATGPLDDLRLLLAKPVAPVVASARAILACIHQAYERSGDSAEQVIEDLGAETLDRLATALEEEPRDLLEAADEAPIIKLVNSLLFEAVKKRASDIHIEPFERELSIRYRIDGVLYNVLTPPKRLQASIISRIKIMAGLNIAEKRLPQDGRIGIKIAGRDVDIRVSAIPTAHGERLVLRLLDKGNLLLKLSEIGLQPDRLATLDQLIRLSHGIVLVTGPTGSGKTTTLYAALNTINAPDKNIITIEDPIEYQLRGVGQMQINPKITLTFAAGLRSILRQDPDVIMVGEIRDGETAEIAIHASLTGHLVFSTLHTNDAAGAVTRLLDMGIEPFLVASSVVAIVAQRLVRVLCPACRQAYRPTPAELAKLGIGSFRPLPAEPGPGPDPATSEMFFKAGGCPECLDTGYRGRIGIYEILVMDDEVRALILAKADANTIKARAVERGMTTLREDGARKVLDGVTTTEEVLRVTAEDVT